MFGLNIDASGYSIPTTTEGAVVKNVWKGMMMGSLTGAVVGIVLDGADGLGRRGSAASRRAAAGIGQAAEAAERMVGDGVTSLREGEIGQRARELADAGAERAHNVEHALLDRANDLVSSPES